MSDIKEKPKKKIKLLDKGLIVAEKTKEALEYVKEKSEYTDENVNEQSIGYIKDTIRPVFKYQSKSLAKKQKKRLNQLKEEINNTQVNSKSNKLKNKFSFKSKSKSNPNKAKGYVKQKLLSLKNTKSKKKNLQKKSRFYSALKANVLKLKNMIVPLGIFGVIAVVIILVITLIAILLNSVFGIFFSSENMNNEKTISQVVEEIKIDLNNKILEIQNTTPHDDYEIVSNMASWEDVLSIYAVKVANGQVATEVVTMDDNKVEILKSIFWEMNVITSSISDRQSEDGRAIKMLTIRIDGKSPEEIMNLNMFNIDQKKQFYELTNEKYKSLWKNVIFGKSLGNSDMVQIAKNEIGNKGGQKFWSWYGFQQRVEWCAIFVSWVANQSGNLNVIVPRFSSCTNQGVPWFKSMSRWRDRGYIPKSGDIIFFDWQQDGRADHVGIVEKVENNMVYTIEGNSGDQVKERNYKINSKDIYGYGIT